MLRAKRMWIVATIALAAAGGILESAAQDEEPAPVRTSTVGELGDVLARVNGKPIRKDAVFPRVAADRNFALTTVATMLERMIDHQLITEKAVAAGLDKDPEYLEQIADLEFRLARRNRRMLVQRYIETVADLATERIPQESTAQEPDADIAQRPQQLPEALLEVLTERQLANESGNARAEWLKQRLSGVRFTLQTDAGSSTVEPIPPAVIEQAATGQANLLSKVREMVVDREAKRRRVEPGVIETDPDLLVSLLAKVVIEAAGEELVLGDIAELEQGIAGLDRNEFVRPIVFGVLTDLIVAPDAREHGIDQDPAFKQQQQQAEADASVRRLTILSELYYTRHGMSPDTVKVSDKEVAAEHFWYVRMLKAKMPQGDHERAMNAIRQRLQQAALRRTRNGYLKALRETAEIEYLIEMPE